MIETSEQTTDRRPNYWVRVDEPWELGSHWHFATLDVLTGELFLPVSLAGNESDLSFSALEDDVPILHYRRHRYAPLDWLLDGTVDQADRHQRIQMVARLVREKIKSHSEVEAI